jgi:hypothetical protein
VRSPDPVCCRQEKIRRSAASRSRSQLLPTIAHDLRELTNPDPATDYVEFDHAFLGAPVETAVNVNQPVPIASPIRRRSWRRRTGRRRRRDGASTRPVSSSGLACRRMTARRSWTRSIAPRGTRTLVFVVLDATLPWSVALIRLGAAMDAPNTLVDQYDVSVDWSEVL